METKENRSSILQMARGAIQERVDYEISRIVDNILDVNTEACAKRKLTLTIELKPDENRQYIKIAASASAPTAGPGSWKRYGISRLISRRSWGIWWKPAGLLCCGK